MRHPLYHAGPRLPDPTREHSPILGAHASPGRQCHRIGSTLGQGFPRDDVEATVYTSRQRTRRRGVDAREEGCAMPAVPLTTAIATYGHTKALKDGTIQSERVVLEHRDVSPI